MACQRKTRLDAWTIDRYAYTYDILATRHDASVKHERSSRMVAQGCIYLRAVYDRSSQRFGLGNFPIFVDFRVLDGRHQHPLPSTSGICISSPMVACVAAETLRLPAILYPGTQKLLSRPFGFLELLPANHWTMDGCVPMILYQKGDVPGSMLWR